jgi:phosphoglycolate phosphatase (TIGR01487 family)
MLPLRALHLPGLSEPINIPEENPLGDSKMKYKALATDVDGTLTSKAHGISMGAIQAIRDLEAKGIPVILASARPYPILNILREYLMTSGAIVCENGGHVDYDGESRLLGDNEECSDVYHRLKEAYGDRVLEAWTNRYNFVDLAIERTLDREEVLTVLSEFPRLRLIDSGFYYHILARDVDKGKGLRVAAEMMGVEPSVIVAIGDSEVDMELLQEAGYGVAVGDASDELKEIADLVTKGENGEGFREAVEILF